MPVKLVSSETASKSYLLSLMLISRLFVDISTLRFFLQICQEQLNLLIKFAISVASIVLHQNPEKNDKREEGMKLCSPKNKWQTI